jgi:hypothetical protein
MRMEPVGDLLTACQWMLSRHGTRINDPGYVCDRAHVFAEEFLGMCKELNIPAETITGFRMAGRVILSGNVAVLIDRSLVIDWAAHQYGERPVPLIVTPAQWREEWQSLGSE